MPYPTLLPSDKFIFRLQALELKLELEKLLIFGYQKIKCETNSIFFPL